MSFSPSRCPLISSPQKRHQTLESGDLLLIAQSGVLLFQFLEGWLLGRMFL